MFIKNIESNSNHWFGCLYLSILKPLTFVKQNKNID